MNFWSIAFSAIITFIHYQSTNADFQGRQKWNISNNDIVENGSLGKEKVGSRTVSRGLPINKKSLGYIVQVPIELQVEDVHALLNQLSATTNIIVRTIYNEGEDFRGFSAFTDDTDDLYKKLQAHPHVVDIRQIGILQLPSPIQESKPKSISQHRYHIHQHTGVTQLHAEGNMGKNTLVCVLDTGVDYTLEELGGCFGPTCKVCGGEDLVGDDFDPYADDIGRRMPVRGGVPIDKQGHGTFICGIIAGESQNYIGVAPNVSLAVWKILNQEGTTTDDVVIEGLFAAKKFGCDVINLSIGVTSGWSEQVSAVVASKLAHQGIFIAASMGNDGAFGPFTGVSPATGDKVMAVGSVSAPGLWLYPANVTIEGSNEQLTIEYFSKTPILLDQTLEIYATSYNTSVEDDLCNQLGDTTPDLSQKVVIARAGGCPLSYKSYYALEKGSRLILFYTNEQFTADGICVNGAMISTLDGERIVKRMNEGNTRLFLSQESNQPPISFLHYQKNNFTSRLVDHFSSFGPSYELQIKPEIVAPGGNVLGAYPRSLGGYTTLSGTSMASAYISGVAALLKSGKKHLKSKNMKNILISTATPVMFNNAETLLSGSAVAPVIQQGGGLVQAYNAVKYSSLVEPGVFYLNDSEHFQGQQMLKIHNHARSMVTYQFSSQLAGVQYSLFDSPVPSFPETVESSSAVVSFSTNSVTIPPGGFELIQIEITPPDNLDNSRLPFYYGFVQVDSTLEERFTIPYLGTTSSMRQLQQLSPPYLTNDTYDSRNELPEGAEFQIGQEGPTVVFYLAFGTPLLSIKIVPVGSKVGRTHHHHSSKIEGHDISGFPMRYVPCTLTKPEVVTFTGTLASGSNITQGTYKIVVSALKIFGDKKIPEDWNTWTSPTFSIV